MTKERELSETLLKSAICAMTEAVHTSQGYEVALPQAYHSGHAVCVVVRPEANGYMVHDNSYAAMLLSDHGAKVGKRFHDRLLPMVESYGCELNGFRVQRTCESIENIGLAMALVGCASRLVADVLLETAPQPIYDFKSSLLSRVSDIIGARRVRANQDVTGVFGAHYKISAVILDEEEDHAVAFVEPVADREAVSRKFKEFYDIMRNPAFEHVARVAVVEDRNNISPGDSLLLQEVSNLVRFSDVPKRLEAWATIQ